jgi:hypothetical protein
VFRKLSFHLKELGSEYILLILLLFVLPLGPYFCCSTGEHVLHLMVLESENVSIYVVVSFLLL